VKGVNSFHNTFKELVEFSISSQKLKRIEREDQRAKQHADQMKLISEIKMSDLHDENIMQVISSKSGEYLELICILKENTKLLSKMIESLMAQVRPQVLNNT